VGGIGTSALIREPLQINHSPGKTPRLRASAESPFQDLKFNIQNLKFNIMKLRPLFAARLTIAGLALALPVRAASLSFTSLTKMTNNGTTFQLSVYDGKAGFKPKIDTGSDVVVPLGDGTLLDWKLLGGSNLNGLVFNSNNVGYSNGPAAYINNPTSTAPDGITPALIDTPSNWGHVWHTSDPGVDFLLNPADQTTYTVLNAGANTAPIGPITGTVNISTITSGQFYMFGGGYQSNTD
jgi:hypothetical protein